MQGWRDRAACIGAPQIVFFPTDRKFTSKTWAAARRLCATCPVTEQCLAIALAVDPTDDKWGMFGGMTPSERRAHRRTVGVRVWV
jgi:WhiB family redox-sensing transcriptional regulator